VERTGATAADFTTTVTFDAVSRVIQVDQPISSPETLTTPYGHDASGNVTRVTNPDSVTWTMTYNTWGLVEDYVEPVPTAYPVSADRTFTTSYDAGSLPTHDLMPGGVTMNRVFDEL